MENKNKEKLDSFTKYCERNPGQRFWQALKNWSEYNFILGANEMNANTNKFSKIEDTFYK